LNIKLAVFFPARRFLNSSGDGRPGMKGHGEKKSLLIVDDVELFIQLQISHLGHQRYDIHTARSGSDGLEMARSLKPDLILMDMFMPDMNGDQVCRILKGDPDTSSIPVVLVSSGARGRSRASSVSSNCDGLVFKPVRRDLLLSVVENLLGTNLRVRDRVQVAIPGFAILDEKEYPITIHSLSSEGAFIEIELQLIRGDLMELSFPLPDQERQIKIRAAAAVWCGTLTEGGPSGAGTHFLTIDQGEKKRISSFVQTNIGFSPASFDESAAIGEGSR
jgi:CheY-like chemotaxis protein